MNEKTLNQLTQTQLKSIRIYLADAWRRYGGAKIATNSGEMKLYKFLSTELKSEITRLNKSINPEHS